MTIRELADLLQQNYQGSMSYSNIQSQNQEGDISHRNQPYVSPAPHSQASPAIVPQQKQWVATYLDGQYYLTDPESISKLHLIEAEIEKERNRLARLQQDTLSHNNSYLSFQEDSAERHSEKSFCTEFNQSSHFTRQQKVKEELEKQQDQYREKLKVAQRQKMELKKNTKLQDKKKEQQRSPSRKKSALRHPTAQPIGTLPNQNSAKISRKPSQNEQKEKSYHKSRIQKSIKENGQLNVGLRESPQKSHKLSVQQSHAEAKAQTQKSINIIVIKPDNTIMPKEAIDPSAKGSFSPKKSVKQSQKADKEPSAKAPLIVSANEHLQKLVASEKSVKKVPEEQIKSAKQASEKEKEIIEKTLQKEQQLSEHNSKMSRKGVEVEVEAIRSIRVTPSVRESSKHSKVKQLEKSIKLSERLNNEPNLAELQHKQQQIDAASHRSNHDSLSKKSSQDNARSILSSKAAENPVESSEKHSKQASIKSQKIENAEVFSRRSSKKSENQAEKSKKSRQSSVKKDIAGQSSLLEDIVSRKQEKIETGKKQEELNSHREDVLSKKNEQVGSNKNSMTVSLKAFSKQQQPISPSIKSNKYAMESKSITSQHHSFSKKSAAPLMQAVANSVPSEKGKDSRVSEINKTNPAEIKHTGSQIQAPSVKQSSFGQESSLKQSSKIMIQMNQQLKPERQDAAPQYDMRKRKMEDNQSQKKSRSFVIHSRNGSVKDKHSNNSQISSPSRKSKNPSSIRQSVTKVEILKLHEQIAQLQDKLRKVQERQQQMEKMEGTLSKIHLEQQFEREKTQQENMLEKDVQSIQNEAIISQKQDMQIKKAEIAEIPVIQLPDIQVRAQPRLQIESSILQVNTLQEVRKKKEQDSENVEKEKLKEEISRLKRIIRDMQIEKIRSIDLEADDVSPALKASRIEKESMSSVEPATPTRRFGSTNKRLLEDAGKIVHNNSGFTTEFPKRKSISKLRFPGQDASELGQLPPESNSKRSQGKIYIEARKGQLAARINEKERDFHSFIESSRVIAEENGKNESENIHLKNFSKATVAQDVEYSRLVQEMRKPNPQEEDILPEIHLRDLQIPVLPDTPHANMSQEELLTLARTTYLSFGIDVQAQGRQLCVKKYKNCVIFTIDGQHHQCVLWHFSGKFYMGSWRAGEPGQGEKDGEGLQLVPNKHIYKGQFLAGKRHGSGILKQSNGNIYDGQWADGAKSGRGVYLDAATKVIYSGQWHQGRKEGQGFLKLSEKEYYYGTFVRSIKEGFGVQVFVNGDKYRGEYKAGKFHGRGKYIWANGSCYEGQFYEGVRHGQGSWRSASISPDIYIGSYERDKKTGYGRYVWANGCMYEGGFVNDLKHGKGRLTYQDGKEIKGIWEDGNLISTEPDKRPVDHEDQPLRRSVKVSSFLPASAKRI